MSLGTSSGFLGHPPSNLIGGEFRTLGHSSSAAEADQVESWDPAWPDRMVWQASAPIGAVAAALDSAQSALPKWSSLSDAARREHLLKWRDALAARQGELSRLLTMENGKTLSESRLEAKAMVEKVNITLDPISAGRVAGYDFAISPSRRGACTFRPHGVMAVIGPFNFPAHLPNGHIVPALLAGNTVVFKPSERTPAVGQFMGEVAVAAGLPHGAFNVVQGAARVASALVADSRTDGILFTGSWPVGRRILEATLDRPGLMVALEMGGSNAAIVREDCHMPQALVECVRSAFATAGQRCTCTRRIIVDKSIASQFISQFCKVASTLLVGPGDASPAPFMGPLISKAARDGVLAYQASCQRSGARVLLECCALDRPGWFLTAGVIERSRFSVESDAEVFGPLVQIAQSTGDDDAIEQANATSFGLAASVFTASADRFRAIAPQLRAGCINWNVGTAGASSRLPFGGLGNSGNNRPAGAFSLDYCAAPIAHIEESGGAFTPPEGMRPL